MLEVEPRTWTWEPWWDAHNDLVDRYNECVRDWNRHVVKQNVGRPLAASEAQCVQVLKLHKAGQSLRAIAEETSLGLRTVRTIVEQKRGNHQTAPRQARRQQRCHGLETAAADRATSARA